MAEPRWIRGAPADVVPASVRVFGRRTARQGRKIRCCPVLVPALEYAEKSGVGLCSRGEEAPSLLRAVWDSETSSGNWGAYAESMDIRRVVGVKSRPMLTSAVESKCLLMNLNTCWNRG
jgi:hypothetical protein